MHAEDYVEIRIHGVSGTPPSHMLGLPGPEAVQRKLSYTDTTTSFFVPREQYVDPHSHQLEAYSWGSLTAGGSGIFGPIIRAGWLLLLPFALVNVAYWSRPGLDRTNEATAEGSWPRWVTAGAVKWAGLMLTMVMVTAACVVAIDLLAIGCFQSKGFACEAWAKWPFGWLGQDSGSAGRRVALAAFIPLGLLTALLLLSFTTKRRYEAVADETPGDCDEVVDSSRGQVMDDGPVLRREKMWEGQARLSTVQWLHLAGGIGTVALYGSMVFLPAGAAMAAVVLAVLGLAAAALALAFTVGDGNDFFGPNKRAQRARRVTYASLTMAVGSFVVFLFAACVSPPPDVDLQGRSAPGTVILWVLYVALWSIVGFCAVASRAKLPALLAGGVPWALTALAAWWMPRASWASVLMGAAIVLALVGVGWWWHRRHRLAGHAWGGAAPGVVLGAALLVATLFTLVAVFSVGWIIAAGPSPFLNVGAFKETVVSVASDPTSRTLPPTPLVLDWLAIGMLPWLVALVGIAMSVAVWRFRRTSLPAVIGQSRSDALIDDEEGWQPAQLDVSALGRLAEKRTNKRVRAARTHRAERLIGMAAIVTLAAGYSVVTAVAAGDPQWSSSDPVRLWWVTLTVGGTLRFLAAVGVALAFLVSLALVSLAARMFGSASLLRSVGVLWDLTTFLPRTAHPFAPPCYAERVVPEVTRRIREVVNVDPCGGMPSQTVILSGHSQGSTLAVAVASRLSDAELRNVRLITYGSQLRVWFGRIFPGVLGSWALGNEPLLQQWDFSSAAPDAPAQAAVADYPVTRDRPPMSLLARMLKANEGVEERPWVNLYRRTDPIGFRVFTDGEAAADVYLSEADTMAQRADPTLVPTHSDYPVSQTYADVIAGWLARPPALPSPRAEQ